MRLWVSPIFIDHALDAGQASVVLQIKLKRADKAEWENHELNVPRTPLMDSTRLLKPPIDSVDI